VVTIIQSGSQAWAVAAAGGDLHVYSREEAGEWIEVLLSEDSEQLDRDGSSILEALYEQHTTTDQNGHAAAPEAEQEEPEDEEEEPEGEGEQPEDEEEEPEDEDEEPEEEEKPRRSRARTRTRKK
jgi:outer membrane biosynthesis protein TonB